VRADGNVGIGTASPGGKLDIYDTGSPVMRIGNATHSIYMGVDINQPWIGTFTSSDLRIVTNGTEKVRVLANGYIGIGTASPGARLEVRTDGINNVYRASDSTGQYRWRVDQNFDMFLTNTSNVDTISIKNNGNILIN